MRRTALPIAVILLAVLAAAVVLARVGDGATARAAVVAAGGNFEIDNSADGLPIFAAAGIGPGDSAEGTVEIAATGSVPVALTLSRGDLLDVPGLGGGLLSAALTLTVTDVTDPGAPRALYDGPLATMPERQAGRVEPGASRTYSFLATLPADAGSEDQNALQGASVSVAYSWTATAAGEAGEAGDPGRGGSGGGAGGAPGANPSSPIVAPLPGGGFELTVRRAAKRLRGDKLLVWAGCNSACAIVVGGRLRATAAGHHRGARLRFGKPSRYRAGVQKLRLRVPAELRRWLATAPGNRRLRAKLTFAAIDPLGARDRVSRRLALKPPRRR